MSGVLAIPLKQSSYVQPTAEQIIRYAKSVTNLSLKEIVNTCISDQKIWENFVEKFMDLRDIEESFGECFQKSVTLCSILRASGWSDAACFVIITCHQSENYGEATHAMVLLHEKKDWLIIDTTKETMKEAWLQIGSLAEFTEHNRVICIFNDIHGFLADGDGVVSELPL